MAGIYNDRHPDGVDVGNGVHRIGQWAIFVREWSVGKEKGRAQMLWRRTFLFGNNFGGAPVDPRERHIIEAR